MRILKVFRETISDGPGFRYSIYFSGCSHACPGCHNEDSWDPDNGEILDSEYFKRIVDDINRNKMLSGVTLSGGDPFYNPEELLDFLIKFRKEVRKINIWCYTGYTIQQLLTDEVKRKCLEYIDVLVDGRFIQELHSEDLSFRGSRNQRIIDIKEFIKENNIEL
jgi:anaerobic ribonucleoside-triphosphate reductase activating protein